MGIQFVYGPAGSGKSTKIMDMVIEGAIKNPQDSFLYIVPDQFTMQTQMDIVKRHPNGGILNIDVLSFSRLSYRVFSETGKTDIPVLDDTGKSLVLRRVASKVSEKMPYIGKNLSKIGYIHEVKSSISEFMQYGLSVKDVEKLSESVNNELLKRKLSDLSVIYGAFMEFNKDKFITNEETLDLLAKRLPLADFIKGSTVVFDGFTGFTPIQENIVVELCKLCKDVILAFDLSLPEKHDEIGGEEKLFYLSRRSAKRLSTMATDAGVSIKAPIIISGENEGRFSKNPELKHLEANLFRFPAKTYTDDVNSIFVFTTENIENEVSKIALTIHELVRTKGYAYRDIAVVTGNLEAYAPYFEGRMRELDMPFFIDKTSGISLNPFTEYLKSSLRILEKDYSYDSVFHYLRSGFTGFTFEEIDRFERYVTSLNIRGKSTYHKEFKKFERGVKDKNLAAEELIFFEDFRKRLILELSVLERPSKTAGDYAKNLYDFLTANNSYEKLKKYKAFFESENNLSKAKEYDQIYKCIMQLLDTIVSLLGDEEMDITEFYKIFEAGIGEIEVGTIPKNVDRVVIGDIERTRINEVKALFFAGVNDGNIPKSTEKGGILSEAERETIMSLDYDLAPTPREEMYTQRLYLYMNLCKPTDCLYLSFSGADTEGKGLRPSYLIDVCLNLFSKLKVEPVYMDASIDKIVTLKDSFRYYSKLMREYVTKEASADEIELSKALLKVYREEGALLPEEITDAAFEEYVATPLSKEMVKLIYGATIKAGISRMEMYAGCAYAHFLKYGMELKETTGYEFEASDLGTIYHGVLDCFSSELARNNLSWSTFEKEEGKKLIAKAVNEYCENYEQGLLADNAKSRYTIVKITKMLERTVDTLQFHVKQGKFKPLGHEYPFSREITLNNNEKMILTGKIDRMDIYEKDNRIYIKILDYKSGTHDVDVTNIYHGIEQQLAVYMSEAVFHEKEVNAGKTIVPSAMIYYVIDNPVVEAGHSESDEEIESKIRKELKVKGLFESSDDNMFALDENVCGDSLVLPLGKNKDGSFNRFSIKRVASEEEMNNLLSYVNKMVKQVGTRITEGDKAISPMCNDSKDACKYCDYKAVCRLDEKIPGFKVRNGKEIEPERAREIVMGGDTDELYLFD